MYDENGDLQKKKEKIIKDRKKKHDQIMKKYNMKKR